MYCIQDIIDIIEEHAPLESQLSYDKCGLKTGNTHREVTGVLTALDLNCDVVREAKEKNCNLICEHHPSIWRPLSELNGNYPKTRALISAFENDIAVYSAHTNVDLADGGLNDLFCEKLGLTNVQTVPEGRIGETKDAMTLASFADYIKKAIKDNNIRIIGDRNKLIRKVGAVNGAGGGDENAIVEIFAKKTDVLVTAEVKYNVARLSKDIGYAIIEVGHFTSEIGFNDLIADWIKQKTFHLPVYATDVLPDPYM